LHGAQVGTRSALTSKADVTSQPAKLRCRGPQFHNRGVYVLLLLRREPIIDRAYVYVAGTKIVEKVA
jgi:hypothetical protein